MRSVVFSASIADPPRMSGSVILDGPCSKRYGELDALADAAHEPAAHADPAPRRRLAQAPADGRRPAAERRLDPARNYGDHRAVPVARAKKFIAPQGRTRSPAPTDRQHVPRNAAQPPSPLRA